MKLHMYRNSKQVTADADGDGTLDKKEEFPVKITDGKVRGTYVYIIKHATSPDGDHYHCLADAGKGEMTRFKRVTSAELEQASEESFGAMLDFQSALAAVIKKVEIKVDDEDLAYLKRNKYKLCFAKKVGDEAYNVVWQSYTEYLAKSSFSWTPQYQLFGSNRFNEDVTVEVATNPVDIGLGETSTLDLAGVLSPPKTGGPKISITMVNNFGRIHPGLSQLSTGIRGEQVSTPIYVAPLGMIKGQVHLTPIEKVLVWFEQNIETSTMFSDARSFAIEIDLTQSNEATRLFQNQEWITP